MKVFKQKGLLFGKMLKIGRPCGGMKMSTTFQGPSGWFPEKYKNAQDTKHTKGRGNLKYTNKSN